jgi:predicted phage terminase large subunit-like protein
MTNSSSLSVDDFTDEEVQLMLDNLDAYEPEEQAEIERIADILSDRKTAKACADDFIEFCKHMQPDYKVGKHHRRLADLLMDIATGEKDRVCVNMPPRHGKSQMVSIYFPAWFLGKYPNKKVLMVSHTTDLAVDFGRKVRNIIDSADYKLVFPNVNLAADSKSAGRWSTNSGGEYFACGVGSALAGRGADLLLVDDPHNEQDIINGNFDVFDKAYEWFTYGARTRLMPGGRVAIVQCMTGDTPVLMADNTEKPLQDIRPGDVVATHDHGVLSASTVLNHKSNGVDYIYTITTTCGKVVRANERHPFLVQCQGELRWVRLKNLKVGDTLVSLKGAPVRQRQQPNRGFVTPVNPAPVTTANTQTPRPVGLDIGENTGVKNAVLPVAQNLHMLAGCVHHTTTKIIGLLGKGGEARTKTVKPTSNIGTVFRLLSTGGCWMYRVASALSVGNPRLKKTLAPTGTTSYASIIATAQEKFGRFCAMIATLPWGTPKQPLPPLPLPSTCDFTTTKIESITPAGREEVFDLQVARTENFIAGGLVSHNTRWHQNDLSGRVIGDMTKNEGSDQYDVIEFPAIVEVPQPDGSTIQKPLWPEFFDMPALLRTKASMPTFQWNAQYQQNPTSEEASVVKREWWKNWEKEDPPKCEYIIMSLDAAAESHNRADYTALTTWGVFLNEEEGCHNIILLNSIKKRLEFPELKELAYAEYREWEPDAFIVEKKSAGTQLYQEMRRTGIPVGEFTPHRGSGDKLARLNSVADIVRSGLCWVPDTRWAEEVVEEIAGFPFMSNDDLVDSTVMALMRFRAGGFIRLPSDEADEIRYFKQRQGGYY